MKTNWLWIAAGVIAISSIPATAGIDAEIAAPLGAALLAHGFGII